MCLGSYCFCQNKSLLPHGMAYLSNGNPTEAVDVMHYCWKGHWPEKRAPSVQEIFINGKS